MKYPSEALETSMMAKSFWRTSVPEASGVSTLGLLLRVLADFLASADLDDFEEVPDFVELLDSLDAEPLAEASAFAVSEALAGGLAATGVSAGELPAAAPIFPTATAWWKLQTAEISQALLPERLIYLPL